MELFFAPKIDKEYCYLDGEESTHLIKVMRHRRGDAIHIIDGQGTLYQCILEDNTPKGAVARIMGSTSGWGGHPYNLTLAVCPTKNNDRFEWMVEKAVELGVDRIVPVIGDRSERKIYKPERARRIALAAAKQSLKAAVPEVTEPLSVRDFIQGCGEGLRLIAYCFEGDAKRLSIKDALSQAPHDITILIGPEGDFSPEEVSTALGKGFLPVHLGPSRLRTETAAVTAAEAVYFTFL